MSRRSCRGMVWRLSDYIDGELGAPVCGRFDAHLADCAPCVRFIATLRKTVRTLKAAGGRARLPARARRKLRAQLRRCVSVARSRR